MSKTIYFNVPSHGHVNPSLGLVRELVDRGETVIYFCTEEFRSKIENAGAIFYSYPGNIQELTKGLNDLKGGYMPFVADKLMQATVNIFNELESKVRLEAPEYLIVDSMCLWGRIIGKKLGLPVIESTTTFAFTPVIAIAEPVIIGEWLSMLLRGRAYIKNYKKLSREFLRIHGIKCPHMLDAFGGFGKLNFVYTSATLQPMSGFFGEQYRFIGPFIVSRKESMDFPFARLSNKPVVYISMGTIYNKDTGFYLTCLDAFRDTKYTVVMSVGKEINIAKLGKLPGNFIVENYVPQLEVLQHSDVFVSHGGMNSTHEALYFGVPLVFRPHLFEQEIVASRISKYGAGSILKRGIISPVSLRSHVEKVLYESKFRNAAQRLSTSLREAGGAQRAVDDIFKLKN